MNFLGNNDDRKKLSPAEKEDITIHRTGNRTIIMVTHITTLPIQSILAS